MGAGLAALAGGVNMRVFTCPHCGHRVEYDRDVALRGGIEGGSGKPNVYVLKHGRSELHRCDLQELQEGRRSAS